MYIRPAFNEIFIFLAVICIELFDLSCAYADNEESAFDFESDSGFVFDESELTENTEDKGFVFETIDSDDFEDEIDNDIETDNVFAPSRRLQPISEVSSTVYKLTSKDIATHGFRSLSELLRHIPGIQIQTAESHFQAISAHGLVNSSASRTRMLLFVDDIPINDVHNGQVYIDDTFPIDLISRIEVITEPSSSLYGPGAFQGSIHIYTKHPSEIPAYGQYRLSMDSNLTFKGSASAGYDNPEVKFGILGHVSGGTTQGDGLVADSVYQKYLMEQASESVINGKLPTNLRRSDIKNNSQKSWYHLLLAMHYDNLLFNINFNDIYSHVAGSEIHPFMSYDRLSDTPENQTNSNETGVLPESVITSVASRFYRRMLFSSLSYHKNFTDWFLFNTQLSYHLIQDRNYDYYGIKDETIHSLEHQLDYLADFHFSLSDSNTLSTGLAVRYQTIHADDLGVFTNNQFNNPSYNLLTPSIWLRDEQHLWSDRIILNASARYDAYQAIHQLKHDVTWEAGFIGKWHPVFSTRIHYSYAINEPSFYQLYAHRANYIRNTIKLDKEKIHFANLSLDFTPKDWINFSFSGYFSYITDLILDEYQTTVNNIDLYHPTQDTDANIYGAEFKFGIVPDDNWKIYGYYHFLYSLRKNSNKTADQITDDRFADDSMHKAEVGFSYNNEYVNTDLALFLVSGTPSTISAYNILKNKDFWRAQYSIPTYFIIQPSLLVKLPAEFGLSINGSYAISKGLMDSPTYRYYYQKEGVPTNRYSLSFSILYPCQ